MLKILQREEWVTKVERARPLMMNEQLAVVNHLCKDTKLSPNYLVFESKDKIVVSFIALVNGNKIKHPFHFFYSSFWIDNSLTDTKYCQCVEEFIAGLLQIYRNVEIKLPIQITDVRPFLWYNFSVVNYYTYIKKLDQLDYHPVTAKNIRKVKNAGYECRQELLSKESLQLNLKIFADFKVYSASSIKKIEQLISNMSNDGYLTCFNCYRSGELAASNLIFLDKNYKIAYTVLLNKTSRANKDDVHSLLHDFFFTELKETGFELVDLLGGDMAGIAPVKSRFNTMLQPHFLVKYNKSSVSINKAIDRLKYYVKRILARMS